MRYWSVRLGLLVGLLPLACSPSNSSQFVPVSGRVTMDNRPLAKATIRFQPAKRSGDGTINPDSYGETDEEGKYTLKPVGVTGEAEGAVVGQHYVQITLFDHEAKPGPRETIPPKYNRDSQLNFTVPPEGAKDKANFDLKSR